MMSGIVKVGTGSGQFLVPLIATLLITAYGWRNSYLIIGAVVLVIFVVVAQVLSRDPQGIGLFPDGDSNESCDNGNRPREESVTLRAAARTGQFWIICIAEFAIFFCLLTVIVHIVPHAMDLELTPPTAVGVLSTIGFVSMLGRIVIGTANDKIGGKRSLVICFILLLCSLFWLHVASEAWMLFLFAVIYGFAHGGFFTVMSPMIAEFFGTGSHGVLFGMVLASGTLGGAAGPLMAGRVFDVTGSYRIAFLVLTLLAVIGFVLITLLRPPREEDAQASL
jgi:predicted MFS family arabinose efflux permease